MTHEDLSEPDRYSDARNWQPKPSGSDLRKRLDAYKKAHPEEFCRDSIFETRPANDCTRTAEAKKQPYELFGPLWRTGELAVLVGESGVGKSVLAVQIAESIARGKSSPPHEGGVAAFRGRGGSLVTRHSSRVTARDVLYLDLEHSDAQFAQRYRCPSPIPGKLPVRYRFSTKLSRTTYGDLRIPEAFRGDVARYYRHSLNQMLTNSEARVLIVDNLTLLDPRSSGAAAAIRTMQMLKRLTLKYGFSILVLAQSKQKVKVQRSAAGDSYSSLFTVHSSLTGIADSVIAIGRTSFDESMRYIKPLKVRTGGFSSPPARGGVALASSDEVVGAADGLVGGDRIPGVNGDVSVYQLGRSEGPAHVNRLRGVSSPSVSAGSALVPHSESSPPYEGGVSAASADGVVLSRSTSSSLVTLNSQLTAKPFLGFQYLGVAPEADLIRDYEREYREAEARERSRLKKLQRSSREILVDGIIDGSYERYLKG